MLDTFTIEARRDLAKALWREGKFAEARDALSPVSRLEGVPRALSIATSCILSVIEQSSGRPRAAIAVLRTSEGLVKATGDHVLLGQWLNTMGINHRLIRRHDDALNFLTEAVDAHESGRAFDYAAQSRANIGNIFLDLGQSDAAHSFLDEALRRCEAPEVIAQVLESKSRALLIDGRLDEAEGCAMESVRLLEAADRPALLDESLKTLGAVRYAAAKRGGVMYAERGLL
jgi:tetratricopeptide (TPR) repeat protein